ncbi:protein-S-isoprenylcysteine O-methyltransferase [Spirosoma sp. KNUC1025]|uniref:protein-S-isoprenylcysteine O-methyltransferase n=1 Tax=Spirosoma sp. KNUC1025 TaxID=2894082 RepID=UPI00386701DD|nr:isoprenylcysteine carboxylmethyltransferase family protein [Spirosoma sp. KNUC1025]
MKNKNNPALAKRLAAFINTIGKSVQWAESTLSGFECYCAVRKKGVFPVDIDRLSFLFAGRLENPDTYQTGPIGPLPYPQDITRILISKTMSQEFIFRIALLACFLPGQVIRQYIVRKKRAGKIIKSVNQKRELLMYRLGVILFILPVFYSLTTWLDFAHVALPLWLRWIGFGILLVATILLILTHNTLGSNWTGQLHIQANHKLIVQGIYAYIRHPMYLSFLLLAVGTLLLSANWLIGVPLVIWFWVMYLGRINQEEQLMLSEFGDSYKAYMRSTGRLFPRLPLRSKPRPNASMKQA